MNPAVGIVPRPMVAVTVAGMVGLIPVLAATYGAVMAAVALVSGWHLFRDWASARYRRDKRVSTVVGTVQNSAAVR